MSGHHHKRSAALAIDKTLTIPDNKPDIAYLLRLTPTAMINNVTGGYKQIAFSGLVLIHVEYVACLPDGTQPIHFVSFEVPFEGLINHRHARPDVNAQLKAAMLIHKFHISSPREVKIAVNTKVAARRLRRAGKPIPDHIYKPCRNLYNADNLESLT